MPLNKLTSEQEKSILEAIRKRFKENSHRHMNLEWEAVEEKLLKSPEKIRSIYYMEETGGEPDVVMLEDDIDKITFIDCSKESPKGRRSLCYDAEALESRKKNKPSGDAMSMAIEMGIQILTEGQYRKLQELEEFDIKTSSWLKTPDNIRKLGGAIFGDRRYDTVFVYHNGAESYYAGRGLRGILEI